MIDTKSRVDVICGGDLTHHRLIVAQCLHSLDCVPDSSRYAGFSDQSLDFAEPVIGRLPWQRRRVLSRLMPKDVSHPMRDTRETDRVGV
ncbi:MAG: hypothetical protein ACFCVA_17360 [Gammaproteobacteria bacterium]